MNTVHDRWYDAIFRRKSRRQFNGIRISGDETAYLDEFSGVLNKEISGARIAVINENPDHVFRGVVGSYGKVKDAPAYVAFIGDMKDPHMDEKVGYIGEFFILEATSRNLATCWIGGFFKADTVNKHIRISKDEKLLAVSPIGYVSDQYSFEEKLMSRFVSSRKRKDMDILCPEGYDQSRPKWVKTALESARLAPSAVNRQPWRFYITDESIRIAVDSGKGSGHNSKRLDCGIAMAHIEVGAWHEGIKGSWDYLAHPDVSVFKKGE